MPVVHQRSFSRQALPIHEPPNPQPSAPVQVLPPTHNNTLPQISKRFRDFIKHLKPLDYFTRTKRTHLTTPNSNNSSILRKPSFSFSPRFRNSLQKIKTYIKMHPFRALLLAVVLILSLVSLARAAEIEIPALNTTSEELPYPLSRMHYASIPRKRKSWKAILGGHLRRDFVVERKEGEGESGVGGVKGVLGVARGLLERGVEVGLEY